MNEPLSDEALDQVIGGVDYAYVAPVVRCEATLSSPRQEADTDYSVSCTAEVKPSYKATTSYTATLTATIK